MHVRQATSADLPFLHQMLFEAAFWRAGEARPALNELDANPQLAKVLAGWGRPGDTALVAVDHSRPVGAAWFRFWTDDDHSYGFVAADIPELGIAVAPEQRSRGIGRALLRALIRQARVDAVNGLSLSVDPLNPARRLYESEGFIKVGESGTSWTYVLRHAVNKGLHAAQ